MIWKKLWSKNSINVKKNVVLLNLQIFQISTDRNSHFFFHQAKMWMTFYYIISTVFRSRRFECKRMRVSIRVNIKLKRVTYTLFYVLILMRKHCMCSVQLRSFNSFIFHFTFHISSTDFAMRVFTTTEYLKYIHSIGLILTNEFQLVLFIMILPAL